MRVVRKPSRATARIALTLRYTGTPFAAPLKLTAVRFGVLGGGGALAVGALTASEGTYSYRRSGRAPGIRKLRIATERRRVRLEALVEDVERGGVTAALQPYLRFGDATVAMDVSGRWSRGGTLWSYRCGACRGATP